MICANFADFVLIQRITYWRVRESHFLIPKPVLKFFGSGTPIFWRKISRAVSTVAFIERSQESRLIVDDLVFISFPIDGPVESSMGLMRIGSERSSCSCLQT
jgi:hypothetical protein